ncbi:MAG: hypothetical protein K6E26_02775, partial [Clostridiales bacterium]|nr:hypothetical protein [Clostridiales bacterium]
PAWPFSKECSGVEIHLALSVIVLSAGDTNLFSQVLSENYLRTFIAWANCTLAISKSQEFSVIPLFNLQFPT